MTPFHMVLANKLVANITNGWCPYIFVSNFPNGAHSVALFEFSFIQLISHYFP